MKSSIWLNELWSQTNLRQSCSASPLKELLSLEWIIDDGSPFIERKNATYGFFLSLVGKVIADSKIRNQFKQFEESGYGKFPICIAKTQYSFSTDPNLKGAPLNHSIPIREVRLSSGAEFIVVVCGEVMTMPGLPSVPAANSIKLNDDGEIEGLF